MASVGSCLSSSFVTLLVCGRPRCCMTLFAWVGSSFSSFYDAFGVGSIVFVVVWLLAWIVFGVVWCSWRGLSSA